MSTALADSALDFATRSHAAQRRRSDGAPFIEHPLEVSRLLREAGCSEDLVAAGLLHDLVEDTDVTVADLTARFGVGVAGLVEAVSDDARIEGYRPRKRALREQVRRAGEEAALLFTADKISKVRELRESIERGATRPGGRGELDRGERRRLDHYRRSLEMLRAVVPGHPLVLALTGELDGLPADSRGRPQRRLESRVARRGLHRLFSER